MNFKEIFRIKLDELTAAFLAGKVTAFTYMKESVRLARMIRGAQEVA